MFVEALTSRVSAHSSSDDPSRYRDESVTQTWRQERDPLSRFQKFLLASGVLTTEADKAMQEHIDAEVRAIVTTEEAMRHPAAAVAGRGCICASAQATARAA